MHQPFVPYPPFMVSVPHSIVLEWTKFTQMNSDLFWRILARFIFNICKNYSIIKENKSFFLFEVFDILGDSNIPLMWKYGGQTITLAFRAHSDLFHETRNFEELKVSLNGPGNAFHTL